MACDLAVNRRRVKWEYLNKENALCKAQFGFLLDGTLARQFWFEFEQEQTNPDWTWLNGGFVLDNRDPLNPRFTGEWVWTGTNPAFEIALNIEGSNYPLPGFPPAENLTMRLESSILRPVGINPGFFVSQQLSSPVANNTAWRFTAYEDVLGTGLAPPEGAARCTPLMACNECESGGESP